MTNNITKTGIIKYLNSVKETAKLIENDVESYDYLVDAIDILIVRLKE